MFKAALTTAAIIGSLLSTNACSLFAPYGGGGGSTPLDPKVGQTIGAGLAVIVSGQQTFITVCGPGASVPPALCKANLANAQKASATAKVVSDRIVATYEAGGDTGALIVELGVDAAALVSLYNDKLKAKDARKRLDPITWITIAQTVIPIFESLYQQIMSQGAPDNSALNKSVATIDTQDDVIQSMH